MATPPRPGDSNYGTAPEGSLSEERAKKAALWVEKEVYKLLGEIEILGRTSGNDVHVTFGELFHHYQDVSDTLVGILARAKKRGLLKYEGQGGHMLFQGKHDSVPITMDKAKSAQWRKEYTSSPSAAELNADSSAAPKKALTVKEQYEEEKRRKSAGAVLSSVSVPPAVKAPPPPQKPVQVPQLPRAASPPAAVARPEPVDVTAADSHSGFLAGLMGKLLPSSPQGSSAPAAPLIETPPQKQPERPVPTPTPAPAQPVDNGSLTKSIMASVSRLLPSRESASEIGEDVLNAVRLSAAKAKGSPPASSASPAPTSATPSPSVTHTKQPEIHHHAVQVALPQRTRDGTRGAVIKSPPSSPAASAATIKSPRPVSVASSTSGGSKSVNTTPAASPSATLKKEQEDWAKKHISRGIVASSVAAESKPVPPVSATLKSAPSTTSAYTKLAPFQDKHKSTPITGSPSNVTKKMNAYEKTKQSSTLPTGLQKRFAWE